MIDKMPSN